MIEKLNEMLKGMDPKKLEEGIRRARAFAETPQGKDFIAKLASSSDQLIKSRDASTLSQSETEALIKEVTGNPELLEKLKDYLNNQNK